ncbi:MAG: ribosome assembly cofactor RimP [Sphingobacteriales bacterium JAD_PAG50586_3]|nr:MAG: ribosome assembly cofactor RimP [Sphingobacteriales bacterium JAD_PAG50586_3]
MISTEQIEKLANEHLQGTPNYLVHVNVSRANKIIVIIDNDHGGINIVDCVALSKFIESNLDREKDDFELEVASHGIGQPLKLMRQYKKNTGRLVVLTLTDGKKVEGTLLGADDTAISIEAEVKDPATKKKELKTFSYPFSEVKQTIVTFKFK